MPLFYKLNEYMHQSFLICWSQISHRVAFEPNAVAAVHDACLFAGTAKH